MKRLRSSDDLNSYSEKAMSEDWGRREEESGSNRPLLHRSSYHKSESGRKVTSSFTRYDRMEDDRDSSRLVKKRPDYDVDFYDRRKSYDRCREGSNERVILSSSRRAGYTSGRLHQSESSSRIKKDFPKGFRSERDRSRHEGNVSSWHRCGGGKDTDKGIKSSGESVKLSPVETDDIGKLKSPRGLKDAKSPPWSRDSGSEQSKSIEDKAIDQLRVESSGNNSKMEEGELEPEPASLSTSEPTAEEKECCDAHQQKLVRKHEMDHIHQIERSDPYSGANLQVGKRFFQKDQVESTPSKDIHGMVKQVNDLVDGQKVDTGVCNGVETKENDAGIKDEGYSGNNIVSKEEVMETCNVRQHNLIEEQRGEEDADIEVRRGGNHIQEQKNSMLEAQGPSLPVSLGAIFESADNLNGRGKSLSLSASDSKILMVEQFKIASVSSCPIPSDDNDIEGPSTRGLELFTSDPIQKSELDLPLHTEDKAKGEKLALDLSLSLPNVLLPIGYNHSEQAPGSPSHGKSIQSFHSSFRTGSEGYTASMSFSGSQQFTHNPSCSLAHESLDFEQSVKSRPLFQGVDWQALASEDPKSNEVVLVQSMLSNCNGSHKELQASQGRPSGLPAKNEAIILQGNLSAPKQDSQLSFNKRFPGVQPHNSKDVRSPTQSFGSNDTGSGCYKDKKRASREKDGVSLGRMSGSGGRGHLWAVGSDFIESIIGMVCSDPVDVVSQRFNEMSVPQMAVVKESARDIILNPGKQWLQKTFQKVLGHRSDITIETLMRSHRTQLEILLAMKTNLHEFLQLNCEISSTDLAEMFLNLRCRNLACRSLLPVDECDCKVCSKRGGFCSACMCLLCSKFDMASNTCSWVGCDVCLHWCHADCGLRESYIRNGSNASGADCETEMQFHCVACDHPSEMFGFVKEVFQNFAMQWTAETLSRELEYVRRIFSASEDLRGKRLHAIAAQMLSDLENNIDFHQIQRYALRIFSDVDDSLKHGSTPTMPRRELPMTVAENNHAIVGSSKEAEWKSSGRLDKAPQSNKSICLFEGDKLIKDAKPAGKLDAQTCTPRDQVFDELESIVRIKLAEAKMFQVRADDARREAEALKCITVSKNERIDEEYTSRISKLQLADAEEMRKKKAKELQAVENAYQDYYHMKMRMEHEIKDMLLRMEANRRNLVRYSRPY